MPRLTFAGLATMALITLAFAAPRKPRVLTVPVDAGVTALTVEVSGNGRICGPARVTDSNGRLIIAIASGQCVTGEP